MTGEEAPVRAEVVEAILRGMTDPSPEANARIVELGVTPAERQAGLDLIYAALEASHEVDTRRADMTVFLASRMRPGESFADVVERLDEDELAEFMRIAGIDDEEDASDE